MEFWRGKCVFKMHKWLELMPYKIHIASSLYTPLLKIGVGASPQATGFVFIQIPWLATGGGGCCFNCDHCEIFYLMCWIVVKKYRLWNNESQVSDDFSDNNPFSILELVNHSEIPMRQIKIRDPPTQNHLPVLCTLPALYRWKWK